MIGTLSLVELVELWGVHGGTGLEVVCLAIIIFLTFSVTIFGHAMITMMNKYLSYALGLGTLILGIVHHSSHSISTLTPRFPRERRRRVRGCSPS